MHFLYEQPKLGDRREEGNLIFIAARIACGSAKPSDHVCLVPIIIESETESDISSYFVLKASNFSHQSHGIINPFEKIEEYCNDCIVWVMLAPEK